MRIPYIINKNLLIGFQPSEETLNLLHEKNRVLMSEEFGWDLNAIPSLVAQCIQTIAKNFEETPWINDLVLCADRDFLLEILPTDLPLSLMIPLIEPTKETLELEYEKNRTLLSEKLNEARVGPATLVSLCLQTIANNFEAGPIINDLMLCADRDYLLEILPTDLPLSLMVPLLEDEIYWKRCFTDKYGVLYQHLHLGWTWKCIYLENHIAELIEKAQPEYNDEESMEDVTTLLCPYIHRLVLNQLQCWKPPLTMDKEDIPDVYPTDHINLEPIFRRLLNIEELEMKYAMKSVEETFTWHMFKVSLNDAKRLGKALLSLKKLRLLSLHTSNIEDSHIRLLLQKLIKVTTLEELNISNCLLGDQGALCLAKMMMVHPNLQKLILTNNFIGGVGGEGIGFALMQEDCCPIKHLNLRLNPLGHRGVMGIFRALVRVQKLEELIISGVGFEDETAERLPLVIQLHMNLKLFDVSNNWLKPAEEKILEAVKLNNTLQWLDLRETDISDYIWQKIRRKLNRNRRGEGDQESTIDEEEEDLEEEQISSIPADEITEEEELMGETEEIEEECEDEESEILEGPDDPEI